MTRRPPMGAADRGMTSTRQTVSTAPSAPAGQPAGIRAEGIDFRYGRVLALRGVDLVVPSGTITSLLGPNGAGKTTMLWIIATLRRPESGTVWIDGIEAGKSPTLVRRKMGFVGHRNGHFPNLSCTENLALFAGFHKVPTPAIAVEEAIARVGLSAQASKRASTLSHGSARRLAIARALLHSPSVLVFDEPYSGLDVSSASALDDLIGALASKGCTILMATHDVERAREISQHLVRLDQGRVAWSAAAQDVDRAMLLAGDGQAGSGSDGGQALSATTRIQRGSAAAAFGAPARSSSAIAKAIASSLRTRSPVHRRPLYPAAPVRLHLGSISKNAAGKAAAARDEPGPLLMPALALARKDLAVEWRARRTLPATVVFALIIIMLFGYAFPSGPEDMRDLAPGVMWVALIFGAMPGLARAVYADEETGALDSIRISPIDRGALFFGPWLSAWVMSVVTACLLIPALVALLQVDVSAIPSLISIAAFGLVGWAAAGVLTSAMAVSARARELLLPVILLPLVLPLILAAVTATAGVLGDPNAHVGTSLVLVGAYDVVFLVAGFLLMPFVLEA